MSEPSRVKAFWEEWNKQKRCYFWLHRMMWDFAEAYAQSELAAAQAENERLTKCLKLAQEQMHAANEEIEALRADCIRLAALRSVDKGKDGGNEDQ